MPDKTTTGVPTPVAGHPHRDTPLSFRDYLLSAWRNLSQNLWLDVTRDTLLLLALLYLTLTGDDVMDKRKGGHAGRISRIDQVSEDRRREGSTARMRVMPSKEKRGRCRKENIGNSISGGATSRIPEYISSSHREGDG
ncbi:uncharacterized protein LOC118644582 [Monomorium pharaonis]|uniref:uncharacterized protein LOC118644582 n=1 Tax=Monomorium pharaonis TaxID=307658 RepID=UPI001747C7F1|nr:uncharacterized protein LOC118644582 [Monomorium pharaonis]